MSIGYSDFTIITGDSLGNTQFWDGKQGTLIEVQYYNQMHFYYRP
jgi:hypothetical protein